MSGAVEFPTQDVVGATSGILLGDFDGIVKVLEFVLSDTLWTHQLPAASRASEPLIYAQHPWIADANALLAGKAGDVPTLEATIAQIISEHGETVSLVPVEDSGWLRGQPLTDLVDMLGNRPAMVIDLDDTP